MRTQAAVVVGMILAGLITPSSATAQQSTRVPAPAPLLIAQAPPAIAAATGAAHSPGTVAVKGFRFSGNTVFTAAELKALVGDAKGKQVTLAELRDLADRIEAYYTRHGYQSVRVIVPRQEVAAGVVTFRVVEPKVGRLTIRGTKRYSEAFVRKAFTSVGPGKVLSTAALERALLTLNEYPGLRVSASLQAGATPGSTDVLVTVTESPQHVSYRTEFNTFGTRYASRERIAQSFSFQNLSGRADSLSVDLVSAPDPSDLLFGQLHYSLPVNSKGDWLHFYGLSGTYDVGEEFAVLGMEGTGDTLGCSLVHPLVKTRNRTITTELGLDVKNSKLELFGQRSSYDKIRSLRVGLTWDELDPRHDARNLASVYLTQGLGHNLGGMANNDPFASRAGADNNFTKLTVELAHVQQVNERTFFLAKFSGQLASDPLVAGEQFSVGGADSVRGYPQSEFLGDGGLRASLELRYTPIFNTRPKWLEDFQTALFVDHGRITNKNPLPGQHDSDQVSGVGLGFRAQIQGGYSLRADLGYALSQRPTHGGKLQPYFQIIRQY